VAEVGDRRSRGETPKARDYLPRFPAHTDVVRAVLPDASPPADPVEVEEVPEAQRVEPPAPVAERRALPIERTDYPESPAVVVGVPVATPIVGPLVPELIPQPSAVAARPRRRLWRLAVGGLVLLGIISSAALLLAFRARPKRAEVPAPPATAPAPAPTIPPKVAPKAAPADPERDLAEWVLSLGGHGIVLPNGGSRRPFSAGAPLPKVKFAVTAISLPSEAAARWKPDDLERLRGRAKLSSIQLHGAGPLTEAALAPLSGLPLRTLELNAPSVQVSGAFLARFPDLETLVLPRCPDFADAELAAVGKLGRLSAFAVNSPRLTVHGFMELRNPGLKSLALGTDVSLAPDHVRVLQRLPLESFESAAEISDDTFIEFALFPDLKRLRLRNAPLTDAALKAVVGLGKLEELRVEGSSVTGPGLEHLVERKGLQVLDLSGGKLSNEALGTLLGLPALKELRLAGNPITDDGAALLAQLDGVEVLDLGETGITDATLQILKAHPTLKTLSVTNTRVTVPAVRDFEAGTPGCKVVFGRRR
jgi:hypothetical protein